MKSNDIGFSFLLGGKFAKTVQASYNTDKNGVVQHDVRVFLADNLEITQTVDEYLLYGAFYSRLTIKNTSDFSTENISNLNDFDLSFSLPADPPKLHPGLRITGDCTKIICPTGSQWVKDEFYPKEEYILSGQSKRYVNTGGRSSLEHLPFFDVNRGDEGIMLACGWSGQWAASFERSDDALRICFGVDALDTFLLPGESIETVSVLAMPYKNDGGQLAAHNKFKRLIKEHFSPIGTDELADKGSISVFSWGSQPSEKMISRINTYKKHGFDFDYFWIDAGWYGDSQTDCPDEFTGDWGAQTGNWYPNPRYHPNGLENVAAAANDAGMKMLVWFEPERVIKGTECQKKHPEWFFSLPDNSDPLESLLLDLGNDDARQETFEILSKHIEKLNIKCYREDFNICPLDYWRKNDKPGRSGMNEIRFVNGLYDLWDRLRERFPDLLIDNCASGGRRIDLMTLQRSIPLWRSDYMCTWNFEAEVAQIHNSGISWWIPYSGTGMGGITGDTYRARSCYSSGMVCSCWGYAYQEFDESSEHVEWVKGMISEFKRARPYFSCDYYPLSAPPLDMSNWSIQCFDRPENNDGMILAFRRPDSPQNSANIELSWIANQDENASYTFENANTGEKKTYTVKEIKDNGYTIGLPEKRSSVLFFYSKL